MASLAPLSGTLGQRRAAHLLRRTSYRFTRAKLNEFRNQTAAQALNTLFAPAPLQLAQPIYVEQGSSTPVTWINPPVQNATLPLDDFILRRYVMAWWVNEAIADPGITHKMAFFHHQYMAVTANTLSNMAFFDYLALMHWGSLGNFKKLATKIVTDNVMLRYLNNDDNLAANPNENFAREFFELFTIGKGPQAGPGDYTTYTEDDIVQAARVFTGFNRANRADSIDAETGIPSGRPYPAGHDFGPKTFSTRFGNYTIPTQNQTQNGMRNELNLFINMVFAQPETARNFCRRIYRYFVSRHITTEIENDIIAPLAQTFITNNFEIKPVLQQLLQSQHFFDADDAANTDEIIGGMIKSPLELALQTITFFNMPIPNPTTNNAVHYGLFYNQAVIELMMGLAGFQIFFPADVAGYSGFYQNPDYHRQWFNSSSIIARYKLPEILLTGRKTLGDNPQQTIGSRLNIVTWVKNSGAISNAEDAQTLVTELIGYLFSETPDADRMNYFINDLFLDNLPASDWTYEWQNYLSTNDDTEVRIALERLMKAIMYAPEYQVY